MAGFVSNCKKKSAVLLHSVSEERGFIVPVYQSGNNHNGHVPMKPLRLCLLILLYRKGGKDTIQNLQNHSTK